MKITEEVSCALQNCVDSLGSIAELSRRTGVRIELLSRFLSRQTKSISQDTWSQIYPLLKPYMNVTAEGDYPRIIGKPTRMHHDLISLSSDEKILLDAFNALPPEQQKVALQQLLDQAEAEVQKQRD